MHHLNWLISTRVIVHSVDNGEAIVPETEITGETAPEPKETSAATGEKSEAIIEVATVSAEEQVIDPRSQLLIVRKQKRNRFFASRGTPGCLQTPGTQWPDRTPA